MAEPDTPSVQDAGELDEALLRAISHPLRHRLLGMLDGRIASPNQLARELGLPLGRVSYHIRLLSDLGAIELVRTEPRRGALEHFYRAVTTVWFSEGDWAKLPRSARRGILGQNLQQIFTDVTTAADNGGFDHPSSLVLRAPLRLNEAGMEEVAGMLRAAIDRARELCKRSRGQRHRLRGALGPALRAPRVSSKAYGGPSTRARRDRGGSGTGRRVDRRAGAPPDPHRDGHDDQRRRRDHRRLRAGAGHLDLAGGAGAGRPVGLRAVRARLARLRRGGLARAAARLPRAAGRRRRRRADRGVRGARRGIVALRGGDSGSARP